MKKLQKPNESGFTPRNKRVKKKKNHNRAPQPDRRQPPPQPDRRQPPQNQRNVKRKRRKKNYTLYYIFFAVVIGIVIVILSNTILFNVSAITVEGDSSYTAEQIIEASELTVGKNLIHINTDDAAQKIMSKLILVDNVKVNKQFPNGIKISISPAERFANIEYEGKYCVISFGDKILIESTAAADSRIPMIKGYTPELVAEGGIIKSTDEAKTKLIHEIYDDLSAAELWDKTTEIDITDRFSIEIVYDGRITLEIGTTTEMSGKCFIAKELIANKIGLSEQVRVLLQDTEKVYVQDNYAHQTLPPAVTTEEVTTETTTEESGASTEEAAQTTAQ